MAFVALDGGLLVPIGMGWNALQGNASTVANTVVDAANEAAIFIGHIITSDGGSHTIDTTGASSLGWRTGTATFANAGTTVIVGLAAVDTATGPPGRAVNVTNVITFDVLRTMTGGGGDVTTDAWQTHVPTSGTKTIANGDLVAFAVQMTARGGADTIQVSTLSVSVSQLLPTLTNYIGGSYSLGSGSPNCIITFSDGAIGYFYGSEVFSAVGQTTWNSGSATKEYGQLFKLPFPTKIYGIHGWCDPDANLDLVLYSDPLGTPVAERTITLDANFIGQAVPKRFLASFSSPYSTTAGQSIGVVFKPGASNINANYKTLANASHRVADPWGANGYGISRATGAFANANSSLDHYFIGLVVGAFEHGVSPTYALGI